MIWSYALTHSDTKRPSGILDTIQTRPRLKLPNSSNRKSWKNLDNLIFTKIVTSISEPEFRNETPDEVLRRVTDIIYNTAADACGTHLKDNKEREKQAEQKRRKP